MAGLNALADEDDSWMAGSDEYPANQAAAAETGDELAGTGGLSALDDPTAQQAIQRLVKSSNQARAALQGAREKIASRKYNRALALLSVSGALGQPTRSGSAFEGFANAANALNASLHEKEAFEADRDKQLLGLDTQIAGLDQNTAQAELQLAALHAKLQAQRANAGNDIVIGPDGKNYYASHSDARGKEAHVTPPAQTKVDVNTATEKGFFGNWTEKRSAATDALYTAAEAAPETIERAKQIKAALKKGAITGTGAELKLGLGKVAKGLGWADAEDWVSNTEVMASQLAKGTLDLIGPSKLGGGSGFSNADREFLNNVSGNKISLDAKTIDKLMDLQIKAQKATIARWNNTYDRIAKQKGARENMDVMGITKFDVPLDDEEAAAAAAAEGATDTAAPAEPPPSSGQPASGISSANAPYGFAKPEWAVDLSNPPMRAPPWREKYLHDHPDTAQDFLDHYHYLPPEFLR